MERTSAQQRAKWVERWKDSGLTAKEFAAEAGLKVSALYYWRSQLSAAEQKDTHGRGESNEQPTPCSGTIAPKPAKRSSNVTSHFVELPIATLTQNPAMLELLFGEVRVRVPSGFDEVTLTRVVRALRVAQ